MTTALWKDTVNPQDLKDQVSRIVANGLEPDPIFTMTYATDVTIKSAKHEWGEKKLKSSMSTLGANINDSATTVTIPTGASASVGIRNANTSAGFYSVFRIDSEEMLVTAGEGTDSLTVTRAYNSTTAAAHTAGATIHIIEYWAEGSDYSINFFEAASTQYNMTQIFSKWLRMSGSMVAFKGLDNDNTLAKQLYEKDIQIMKMIAESAYMGLRMGDPNAEVRRMGGLWYYANKNATSLTLDKAFIENKVILPLLEAGADPSELCLAVPNGLYSKITALKSSLVTNNINTSDRRIVADWDVYEFGSAPLKFMRSFALPAGNVCAFDRTKVKLIAVPGRMGVEEVLGKTGDNQKVMKLSEVTMEVMNGSSMVNWFSAVS